MTNNLFYIYQMFLGKDFSLNIENNKVWLMNDKQLVSFHIGSKNNVGFTKLIEKYL